MTMPTYTPVSSLRGTPMADPGYTWADGHPQRRAAWANHLREHGPVQCGCVGECHEHHGQCTVVIHDGDDWHLGHGIAIKHGGTGEDSKPWCPACNLKAAAWMTNHPINASRNWWG